MIRQPHHLSESILKKGGVKLFREFRKQFSIFKELISTDNKRANSEILRSRATNNPSFALLNAWAILEEQIKKQSVDYWSSRSRSGFIIEYCVKELGLSHIQRNRMEKIAKMRNGVAHAIPDRNKPTWEDVNFILKINRRLKLKQVVAC